MAFVIKKSKTLAVICVISEPKDGGGFNSYKVPLIFNLLPQDRIDLVIRNDGDDDMSIMDEVLAGWGPGAFVTEDGADMPYTEDNKREILNVPYVRNSMMQCFFTQIAGKKARTKN